MLPGTRLARLVFAIVAIIVVLGLVASAIAYPL
jgi:hypothetical protein